MSAYSLNRESEKPSRERDCTPRIANMQRRYQTGKAEISIQRARYYTESWKSTEDKNIALPVRVAMAMKHVYEHMDIYLDQDDRIAGYWSEQFLGIPIDIERGVFNLVLEAELSKKTMLKFRGKSAARGLGYMIRKGVLGDFIRNQKLTKSAGAPPLDMGLKTMSERKINPFQIKDADLDELQGELLPYWRGRTTVDKLERDLNQSGLLSKDMHDFVVGLPGNTSKQVLMLSTCATISTIQGHVILDYSEVLEKGLLGMQADVKAAIEALENNTGSEYDFLRSIELSLDGVMTYAGRLAARIRQEIANTNSPERLQVLERMLACCDKAPLHPAESFEQAVQALWTVKTAVELAHPVNLHCFGRLDQILYPYYSRDIAEGRIGQDEARELLEELLLKIMSQNIRPESNFLSNFYHRFLGSSPVTIGGVKPDGEDGTNALTYLFIEAAHNSRAITNVSLRMGNETPDDLLDLLADCLRQGASSYSLFNDDINIKAMLKRGFSVEDARDYAVMGCVETTCPGRTGAMSASALLLSRLLDINMRNGDSATIAGIMRGEGLETGAPNRFESFEDFLQAFYRQAEFFIDKLVEASNLKDRIYQEEQPAPLISTFTEGCLKNRRDVTSGGAKYDISGISMINSIANLVDSLLVIRELVFRKKALSLKRLVAAVDENFVGHEKILQAIRRVSGKWGNGDTETDRLAREVCEKLFGMTYEHRNFRGGPFVVYAISMITHTIDGRLSIAGPDGRRAATPYAASCNPYNVEGSGPTAALRSVAALPFEDVMGAAVNMKFHPSAIGEHPTVRAKWISLIRTYFDMGGSQLQPTCISGEQLQEAQAHPERHRDLIVKVGGYSTYFVDLGREIQNEIIDRTEFR